MSENLPEGVDQFLVVLGSQPVFPGSGDSFSDLAGGSGWLGSTGVGSAHNIRNELIIFNLSFY